MAKRSGIRNPWVVVALTAFVGIDILVLSVYNLTTQQGLEVDPFYVFAPMGFLVCLGVIPMARWAKRETAAHPEGK